MTRPAPNHPWRPKTYATLAVAALSAFSSTALAQDRELLSPSMRTVTLSEAIAYARANQPSIRVAQSRIAALQAEAQVPRGQWKPQIGITAQLFGATSNNTTGTYVTPAFLDMPRIGGTRVSSPGSLMPYASTIVAAGLTQELFDFGRIAAQSAAADAAVDVERQRARAATLDVTYDVEEAYFAVFTAKAVVRASTSAYERTRVHRDFAKVGVAAGLRPPIELTRAEADLARFDLGRLQATGGLDIARSVLAAAVGGPDTLLDAADAPPLPSEMPSLNDAVARAGARDPRILEALAHLKAEEQRTRAIGAELRPDLSLSGGISGRAGGATPSGSGDSMVGAGFLPYVPNLDVGIVLSWPLFDGTVSARVDASRAHEQVRQDQITLARQQLVAAIQKSYVAVDVARAALPVLRRAAEAARANYAQADARFRAELGTSVELSDAEALLADAEIRTAEGQFEIARARAEFGRIIAEGN